MSIRITGSSGAAVIGTIQASAADATPSEAPAVLPSSSSSLASSGDIGAMISALLLESGKATRETAKLLKDAASACEDAAHARKIDAMETAADRKLVAGITEGAASITEGFMSGLGAASEGYAGKFSAIAKGGGTVDKTMWNHFAADAERDVAQAEREVTQGKRNIESAGDMDKDAKDLLRRAMSHYAEYVRAKDDASKAALFRA